MKVLLINPNFHQSSYDYPEGKRKFFRVWENVPLEYSASVLIAEGFNVSYIDAHASDMTLSQVEAEIKKFRPDFAVISSTDYDRFCCPQFGLQELEACAKAVKENSKAVVIAVGPHGTYWPEKVLGIPQVDIATRREFEYSVLESVQKYPGLAKVAGISYKGKGKIRHNKERELIKNLDNLPFPYRKDMAGYYDSARSALTDFGMDKELRPMALMVGSRGCPMGCIYCLQKSFFGLKYRTRSAQNMADEMELLVKNHKVNFIWFLDELLTLDKRRCIEFCSEILKRGIKVDWCCNSRVDTVDGEMLAKMREAGCKTIMFGAESASQKILDNLKKGAKVGQLEAAIRLCRQAGIKSKLFLLAGAPGDTEETLANTVQFVKRAKPDIAVFHEIIPYPTTELHATAVREGKIRSGAWEEIEASTGLVGNNFKREGLNKLSDRLRAELFLHNMRMHFGHLFYLNPLAMWWFAKNYWSEPKKVLSILYRYLLQ